MNRRDFLQSSITAAAATALSAAGTAQRPRLGVVVDVAGKHTPDEAIARVKAFGLPTCQVGVEMSPAGLAGPLRQALNKYGVEATAVMTLGEGPFLWDFYRGP